VSTSSKEGASLMAVDASVEEVQRKGEIRKATEAKRKLSEINDFRILRDCRGLIGMLIFDHRKLQRP